MPSTRSRLRQVVVSILMLVGFTVVLVRLFTLQVLQAGELSLRADRQHRKTVTFEGGRGTIYDRNGKVFAMNVEVPSVYGLPTQLKNPRQTARAIAPILKIRSRKLERKLTQDRNFVWLVRKLDPERGRRLERLSLEGVGTVLEGRRFYPKKSLLSNVLGFAGIDNQGLEGIERQYESYLRGKKHEIVMNRDALGRTVFPDEMLSRRSIAGHNVILTIDEVVQYVAEQEMQKVISSTQARGGSLIIMEPRSGAILAMAVHPHFNPNHIHRFSPKHWRNRAVTDVYEPGSTMKVFLAAAALEKGTVTPTTLVYGENGRFKVANTIIHDHEPSGWMTFSQVIERSSNIGAVKTAQALGEAEFSSFLHAFGFGNRTGVDLPGESKGLLNSLGQWSGRTLASLAIGQEIAVTPIQLATAFSSLANGGWLMKPYIVSEVRDPSGTVVYRRSPKTVRRVVSQKTVQTVTSILEGVVTDGTGRRAAVPGYRAAGKTGTAQKVDPETGTYSRTKLVTSFAGYLPVDDPRLAIVVVIDEPQTETWGGTVAAPVFRRVAEQILPYLGVTYQAPIEVALIGTDSSMGHHVRRE